MWKIIVKLFRKEAKINPNAQTIPAALGYDFESYDLLVNEMVRHIKESNRFQSFQAFIDSGALDKYKLNVANPRDSMLIGYAFATAVVLQRSLSMHEAASHALDAFYDKRSVH